MANKKINDLALQANPTGNMQIETDIGGITPNRLLLGDNPAETFATSSKTIMGSINELHNNLVWDRVTGTPNYVIPHTIADDIGATAARITKGWFTDIESTNMPTVGGTSINANGVLDLTSTEVTQLANIGTTTISSTQWGYLGAMNQDVASTAQPTFAQVTLSTEPDVDNEAATKKYVDDHPVANLLEQSNVFYAATAGNDGNTGKNVAYPFLTDTAAITAADTPTATETTQVKVELLDGAPFGSFSLSAKPWINIDAPTAFIRGGSNIIGDDNIVNIGTSRLQSGTDILWTKLGSGQSFFSANKLYQTVGEGARLLEVDNGVLFSKVDYFKPQVITDEAIKVSGGYLFDYSQWLTGKITFATDAGGGKIIAQEIDGDIEVGNNFTSHPTIDTQYYSGNVTVGTGSNYGMKVTSAFIGDLTIGTGSECYIHTGLQSGNITNAGTALFNNSQWIDGTLINNSYVAIYANEFDGDIEAANNSYTAINTLYYDCGSITIEEDASFGMQVASELVGNLIVGNGSDVYLYAGSHDGNVSLLAGGYANLTYGELKGDVTLGAGAGIGTSISCVWTGKLIAGANSNVRMVVGERTGAGADEIEATANVHIFDVSKWNDTLNLLTTEEITQLLNIGETTTISSGQWEIVGNLNQSLTSSSSPTFNKITALSLNSGFAITLTGTTSAFTNIGIDGNRFLGWNTNTFFVTSPVDMRCKINDSMDEYTGVFKLESGWDPVLIPMKIWHSGKVAFNVKAEPVAEPDGQFYIKQPINDAAIPVLELEQTDVSEGFINFVGTGKGSVPTSTVNSVASVRVELNGVPYMIALHANIP